MKFQVYLSNASDATPLEIEKEVVQGNLLTTLDDIARRGFISEMAFYYPGRRVQRIKIVEER